MASNGLHFLNLPTFPGQQLTMANGGGNGSGGRGGGRAVLDGHLRILATLNASFRSVPGGARAEAQASGHDSSVAVFVHKEKGHFVQELLHFNTKWGKNNFFGLKK